jgi:hypothetical protein
MGLLGTGRARTRSTTASTCGMSGVLTQQKFSRAVIPGTSARENAPPVTLKMDEAEPERVQA